MKATVLLAALMLGILVAPLAADAQPAGKVYRIGLLSSGSSIEPNPELEAFRQDLRDLGYVEGQNLVMESRYAERSAERLPELATELVRLPVDVIIASGSAAVRAAQHATRTIPIVMAVAAEPVKEGFVASLARPGGNITGLSSLDEGLFGKRLELLKETVPQSMRIAVLANPAHPSHAPRVHDLTVASRALGVYLQMLEVRRPEELDLAFAAMTQERTDALLVVGDAMLLSTSLGGRLADLATQYRLPAMYNWRTYVVAGGLMSYGPSIRDMQRRATVYVDKILKGAKPADLPVEQPTKFELVINLKAAKALGLAIPPTILFQADEVLQ